MERPEALVQIFELRGTETEDLKVIIEGMLRLHSPEIKPCVICYRDTSGVGVFFQYPDDARILGEPTKGCTKVALYPVCEGHADDIGFADKVESFLRRVRQ